MTKFVPIEQGSNLRMLSRRESERHRKRYARVRALATARGHGDHWLVGSGRVGEPLVYYWCAECDEPVGVFDNRRTWWERLWDR